MIQLTFNQLFNLFEQEYGMTSHKQWWPFDTVYEMVIGAILVQNTTWSNTEKSLARLREHTAFLPDKIRALSQSELITLIHSSGFQQNKSHNILAFFDWLALHQDDFDAIQRQYGSQLRQTLLKQRGIGPETADAILLYAFKEPVFIADTYARRLFDKLNAPVPLTYAAVKEFAETNGTLSVEQWSALHGWIIQFAQQHLKPKQTWENNFLVGKELIVSK
ncbi:deoxyribonuclease I [Aerococcaceae bacterium zg-BR22]|uniref:deoxyribonuclease I n=1 Tax=Aerococcaceae bacterium zg-1292 TaxID=2774330 RepID=UPI0040632E6C|nr:deoxyribonuclease I [Aerococcaceae bacterium zg-BR22]